MSAPPPDKVPHDPIHYLRGGAMDHPPELHPQQRSIHDMRRIDSEDEGPPGGTPLSLHVAASGGSTTSAEDPVFLAAISEVLRSTSTSRTNDATEEPNVNHNPTSVADETPESAMKKI